MSADSYHFGDRLGDQCLALTANFLPNAQAEKLSASFQLRDAVLGAATASGETRVCQTQLAWWRDELKRMVDGQARHPASKRFAQHCDHSEHTETLTAEWVVLTQRLIQDNVPQDAEEFAIQAFREYGAAIRLATGPDDTLSTASVRASLLLALCNDWENLRSESEFIEHVLKIDVNDLQPAIDQPTLNRLNDLLTLAFDSLTQQNKPPSALYLLWNAWKSARRHS